jgi:predicted TPR repeat methyltransferase
MRCRQCDKKLTLSLVDLGTAPPSNAYLTKDSLDHPELWFPLRVLVCDSCWLVQTEDFARADELFDADYAYFSGFSSSWLVHSERYVDAMVERFELCEDSHVVEVAANDGYLLQYVKIRGIPCTGVEPTASTATAARKKGIPIIEDFFGVELAHRMKSESLSADLMTANNVLAHVPDINDFVAGFTKLLKPEGVATFEFPHLLKMIEQSQFDTIYHEHFSYLSLTAVSSIFEANGLNIFDVEELPTHGGSLRVFAQRSDQRSHILKSSVVTILDREVAAGLTSVDGYSGFQDRADRIKDELLEFLIKTKREGKRVAAYGAAAKGNTLINYAGIGPDLIEFVVDRNPAKSGKYMPGSRLPIVSENKLLEFKPDYVLILPWNLEAELRSQLSYISDWGGVLVVAVPKFKICK